MLLKTVSEIIWNLVQDGKPQADNQKLSEADISQMVRQSAASKFRQQYMSSQVVVAGKKLSFTNAEPEYYFSSPLLSIKRFNLTEANTVGMRIADMSAFDLYRLPANSHFTNIYPVNNECGGQEVGTVTLVKNGEEKFYAGKEKFRKYLFAAVVGRTLKTYNLPPCVKAIDVETSFDSDDIDISLDVAYEVTNEVVSIIFKTEDATGDMQLKAKEEMKKREDIK